ncbi:hypothetical protein MA16_Dca026582 [Dendrobium catenatum]|uniref:Uncharacterized protein n=1 Tax=Dendrobium catenatum TaxID=906689 RepID=A0A2I0V9W2_9ASPA|nr:hypothetical protein MA16_Dca026582 [Dendrobium catenatum]
MEVQVELYYAHVEIVEIAFVEQEMMLNLICFGDDSNLDITIGLLMEKIHLKMTLDHIPSILMMLMMT